MHQSLYMPRNTLYENKYKYDVASRYKVARLKTKQAKDVAEMIADIYKVGPLTYPKKFQCAKGSEFKGEVTRLLEKHDVMILHAMTKYKHTHKAFVKSWNQLLIEELFKVQHVQDLNDPERCPQLGLSISID